MAFLRLCPVSASGTASATASYIAVPPRGTSALHGAAQARAIVVQSCTSTGSLLKR